MRSLMNWLSLIIAMKYCQFRLSEQTLIIKSDESLEALNPRIYIMHNV